jgi:hypothetical protein
VTRLNTNNDVVNGDLGLTYSNTNSSSFRTNVWPQAAVNPVTGDIYVIYDDAPKGGIKDKADIFFIMSTDGGNTWSTPLRVNDDVTTTDQWQPAIALTPDGTHLFITWYDRRNDPTNDSLIDRYGTIGAVSGHNVTFAPNFRITDVSFPPAFGQDSALLALGQGNYMSDYDMATADNNYFYTTWGDNRSGDQWFANQPDVRFAEILVTGLKTDAAVATSSLTPAGDAFSTVVGPPAMASTVAPSAFFAAVNVLVAAQSSGTPPPTVSTAGPYLGNGVSGTATGQTTPIMVASLQPGSGDSASCRVHVVSTATAAAGHASASIDAVFASIDDLFGGITAL